MPVHTGQHWVLGCCAEVGGAAAENLGFSFQLDMDLQSDDHLIILQSCLHYLHLPLLKGEARPVQRRLRKGRSDQLHSNGQPARDPSPQGRDSAGRPAMFTGTV